MSDHVKWQGGEPVMPVPRAVRDLVDEYLKDSGRSGRLSLLDLVTLGKFLDAYDTAAKPR